jgi:FkbM family methyltransferase
MSHKLIKKIVGALGYKLIDKQLYKNEGLISNKSYLKVDRLLKILFEEKKINNLIQIGANDGQRFDILNFYIKKYQTKSLLVEPIKENFEKLKENYKDCNFISFDNSAISVNNEISYLYKVKDQYIKNYSAHIPGITSFDKKHLIKHGVKNKHIDKESVSSISMTNLISKYNLKSFDLLFIDAEGYDGKIAIDFLSSTTIFPIIILEYVHINNNIFKDLINMLDIKKYNIFSLNENLICFPESDHKYIRFN